MAKARSGALDGKIIVIRRGLAIYKTQASPYYWARVRDPINKRYLVKTTKETSRIVAREVAEEFARSLAIQKVLTPPQFSFKYFAARFTENSKRMAQSGERNANYMRTARQFLEHPEWGLLVHFENLDVRNIKTKDWIQFRDKVLKDRPSLSTSTMNMLSATFRNVLKVARDEGAIDDLPATPRPRQKDNPRSFFRFYPLVDKEKDAYKLLRSTALDLADMKADARGVEVTDELHDLILFVTHTFVRPITSELYALRHRDIQIAKNPKRLLLTIRDGKTGYRTSNSMEAAVSVYERIKARNPNANLDDYIFLPNYKNRSTAARIIQRQFNLVLEKAGLKIDPYTGTEHSVYSLRHTAICMRIILSEGQVNVFNLAKNAGTSVDQIERFYARHLPLSAEMARNLQSFSGTKS